MPGVVGIVRRSDSRGAGSRFPQMVNVMERGGRRVTETVTDPHERWDNPLAARYASAAMAGLWSDNHRYRLWRQAWLALAEIHIAHGRRARSHSSI